MSNQPLYTLYDLNDKQAMTAYPEEIIKSMLYKGLITTLWGPPDSGKSHIAMDIACSVSQYFPVIYICAEAPYEIVARSRAWFKYHDIQYTEGNLKICKDPLLLMHRSHVDAFNAVAAAASKPALVVIDPLAQCLYGGDENQTKDMATATFHMSLICKTLNCSILVVAHTGVNRSRERGSTVLRGACRASFSVDKSTNNKITIRSEKLNAGKPLTERHFEVIQVGDNEMDTILLPIISKETSETLYTKTALEKTLHALCMPIFSNGVSKAELKIYLEESVGLSKSTAYKNINMLVKKGFAELKGASLVIATDDGRDEDAKIQQSLMETHSETPSLSLNWSLTLSHLKSDLLQPTDNSTTSTSLTDSLTESHGKKSHSLITSHPLKEGGETECETEEETIGIEKTKKDDKKKVVN